MVCLRTKKTAKGDQHEKRAKLPKSTENVTCICINTCIPFSACCTASLAANTGLVCVSFPSLLQWRESEQTHGSSVSLAAYPWVWGFLCPNIILFDRGEGGDLVW